MSPEIKSHNDVITGVNFSHEELNTSTVTKMKLELQGDNDKITREYRFNVYNPIEPLFLKEFFKTIISRTRRELREYLNPIIDEVLSKSEDYHVEIEIIGRSINERKYNFQSLITCIVRIQEIAKKAEIVNNIPINLSLDEFYRFVQKDVATV